MVTKYTVIRTLLPCHKHVFSRILLSALVMLVMLLVYMYFYRFAANNSRSFLEISFIEAQSTVIDDVTNYR